MCTTQAVKLSRECHHRRFTLKTPNRRLQDTMYQHSSVVILLLVLGPCLGGNDHRHLRSVLGAIFDSSVVNVPTSSSTTTCTTGCSKRISSHQIADPPNDISTTFPDDETNDDMKQVGHISITAQELTALRIEYIKNKILKKLRLKEKPSSTAQLPQPVEESYLYPQKATFDLNDVLYRHYSDDFYGKTTQAIIFPYEDEAKCVRKIRNPSACVPFQMPNDIAASDVSSVELWFHKEPDVFDMHNQTFVVSEVAHWDSGKSFQKNKPIAILETSLNEGWIRVDVASVIKNWLMYQDSPTHAIAVACKTCGMDIQKSPISFRQSYKPFLVIRTFAPQLPVVRRPKRSVDCQPGSNDCCRDNLYISFAEIGWDDWIIEPRGFNTYFCSGTCETSASLTLNPSDYNTIRRRVMFGSGLNKTQRLEMMPCCGPTQHSSLEVLYTDSKKTIQKKIVPRMIVDKCGCM